MKKSRAQKKSQPSTQQRQKQRKGAKVREKPKLPYPVMTKKILLIPNSTTFAQVNKIKGEKIVEPIRTNELLTPPAV